MSLENGVIPMLNKTSDTRIHPDYTKRVKVSYSIEYTEKDEAINNEMSNLKKIECQDLEQMVKYMFQLRERDKYNINLYTITTLDGQWISEDAVNDTEGYIDSKQAELLSKSNATLRKTTKEVIEELNEYKAFIKLYNSEKHFKDFQQSITA